MCHLNPILLISFQRELNLQFNNIHTMVEGTTMAYTGAIQLAWSGDQYSYKNSGIKKCTCCTSTTSRKHHIKTHQTEQTHQLLHTAEDSSSTAGIPRPTGNQLLYPHKILTRVWLSVWRRYNKFLMHKKWRNWWNNKGLQPPVLKILHPINFMKAMTCFNLDH